MAAPSSEVDVEEMYQLVQKFVLCSHLQWGAWNMVIIIKIMIMIIIMTIIMMIMIIIM